MKNLLIFSCLLFIAHACTPQTTTVEEKKTNAISSPITKSKPKKTVNKDKLSFSVAPDSSTAVFPACDYGFVQLFELKGRGNHSGAASVFDQRTGQSKLLTQQQVDSFLSIINAPKSFGGSVAGCHEPRIGLVFYTTDSLPCSYLSLCLDCNNIYSKPKLNHLRGKDTYQRGFSLTTRKQLHSFLEAVGFPDKQYSPLFDDKELFADFLKHQGLSKAEIETELDNYIPLEE